MVSPAVPLRLLQGGVRSDRQGSDLLAPAIHDLAAVLPPASVRRPILRGEPDEVGPSAPARSAGRAVVVDLAARRRAAHLGELRALLVGLDGLWSALWRSYPGREQEVVELHLRFDGIRDAVVAWAQGDADHAEAPRAALAAQLEGAAILGAPDRGAETWRSLCRQLEVLDDRLASLDPTTPR